MDDGDPRVVLGVIRLSPGQRLQDATEPDLAAGYDVAVIPLAAGALL